MQANHTLKYSLYFSRTSREIRTGLGGGDRTDQLTSLAACVIMNLGCATLLQSYCSLHYSHIMEKATPHLYFNNFGVADKAFSMNLPHRSRRFALSVA